jgi:hypothetical protein
MTMPAFEERRKHERVPLMADLTVEDLGTNQSCSGRSINISRGGISFFSTKCFPTGNELRLTLYLSRSGKSHRLQVHARVLRFSIETRGAVIGAAFDADLTPAAQPVLCSFIDGQ